MKITPKYFEVDNDGTGILANGQYIACCDIDWLEGESIITQKANAAFIVEACNNYERVKSDKDMFCAVLSEATEQLTHLRASNAELVEVVSYLRNTIQCEFENAEARGDDRKAAVLEKAIGVARAVLSNAEKH